MPLYLERHKAILEIIQKTNLLNILDMGCGDGKLISYLLINKPNLKIIGIDNSEKKIKKSIKNNNDNNAKFFIQSFFDFNELFLNIEIIILSEIIEHLKANELNELYNIIFKKYKPKLIIITTPNKSYNFNYDRLYNGLRHSSHIFELSDDDIPQIMSYLRINYSEYSFSHKYCDKECSSHLITAERDE